MNINDIIHGFRVINARHIDEINGDLYEMVHEKTSARTIWLKRDDENKTFAIAFRTTPVDDTGVFHILEHSVLNGSQRYPVREPFVDLLKGSLQTFLNAMTYPDKTVYPVSSRNDKDFINLMRVYLDAVFKPLAVENPNIFRQEGWHYEILDPEADPIYKGVVFNEMKGAFSSPDGVRSRYIMHSLFPDTCYGNESGGDPEHITDLTYQQFCDSHRKYYSPRNSFIFLDGDLNIDEALGIIDDEYLSGYTSDGDEISFEMQKPVAGEDTVIEYEVSPEDDPAGKAQVAYGYVVGDYRDRLSNTALALLSQVLCGSNESPLKKAIIGNGLGEDVYFSIEDGLLQSFVEIDVINTDLEKEPQITETIKNELKRIISEGIDKQELNAVLSKAEFKAKERDFGNAPKGLVFALSSLDTWLYGGDPIKGIIRDDIYTQLREKMDTDYFEQLLQSLILDSKHHAKVLLKPSGTLGQIKAEKEKRKLAAAKASWSKEDIEELVDINKKLAVWQATEDTPEQQATLPVLHISDLKKTATKIPLEVCRHGGRNVVLKHELDTNGISYVTLYSDVSDFNLHQLSLLSLLSNILGQIATEKYDTVHLTQAINATLGEFGAGVSFAANKKNELTSAVTVTWSTLERNDLEGVDLIKEIMYNTRLDDLKAIRDIVRQIKTSMEQAFIAAGNRMGVLRVSSYDSEAGVSAEYANGYEFYRFIKNLEENWDSEAEKTINEMKELYSALFIRDRLTIGIASATKPRIVMAVLDDAPEGTVGPKAERKPLGHRREGIVVPANISYACMGSCTGRLPDDELGTMYVISNILTYDYLWNNVRVKNGAYGTGFAARGNAVRYMSYRDPNPANSLRVFKNSVNYLKDFCSSDQNVEKYIIGTMGDFDPLMTVKTMAKRSDIDYFTDYDDESKQAVLDAILSCDKEKISKAVALLETVNKNDNVCVVGNKDAIENCKDQLDEIFTF